MKSKTVGLQTKLGLVRKDLAAISYPHPFDEAGAVLGKPCALIPVLRYLLEGGFSPIVASQFDDLRTTDRVLLLGRNFVNLVFLFAHEVLKIKSALTAAQFMLEGLAERKLTMLHQFITACREHDGAHTVEGLRFVKSKQTHLGQQGMSGQLDGSHTDYPICNDGINEVKQLTKKSKRYDQKLNHDATDLSDNEPRPFPLNICEAASTEERNLQESSMLQARNKTAGANLSLLEINALQQRITSTECFYQQLRNAFTALQIKVEANLRVLEARVNALERDRHAHTHHRKWSQNVVDCEPQYQQLSTLTKWPSSNTLFQPVDKPLPSAPKIDICPDQVHLPSNKIAANLNAALEQAKNTLTELHCHLA